MNLTTNEKNLLNNATRDLEMAARLLAASAQDLRNNGHNGTREATNETLRLVLMEIANALNAFNHLPAEITDIILSIKAEKV